MKTLMKYLNAPELVSNAKKKHDIKNSVLVLVAASLIFGVSVAANTAKMSLLVTGATSLGMLALSTFLLVFLGGVFYSFVIKLTALTLGGKGGFFEGITTVAYSLLYLSFGVLAAALFGYIQVVGAVFAFASVLLFGVVAYATLFRSVKELFGTDMLIAFIVVSVVFAVSFLALYVGIFFGGLTTQSLLSGLVPGA